MPARTTEAGGVPGRAEIYDPAMSDVPAPTLPLHGRCACGVVTFELSAPLLGAAYCHCTICQHRTGAAAGATALAAYDSLTITDGEEHVRS